MKTYLFLNTNHIKWVPCRDRVAYPLAVDGGQPTRGDPTAWASGGV